MIPPKHQMTTVKKKELLREKVKYVFVIYHENESFDHYFGTFPGANGLFTAPDGYKSAKRTKSFVQEYLAHLIRRMARIRWRM